MYTGSDDPSSMEVKVLVMFSGEVFLEYEYEITEVSNL